jgi:hypothetical protein
LVLKKFISIQDINTSGLYIIITMLSGDTFLNS